MSLPRTAIASLLSLMLAALPGAPVWAQTARAPVQAPPLASGVPLLPRTGIGPPVFSNAALVLSLAAPTPLPAPSFAVVDPAAAPVPVEPLVEGAQDPYAALQTEQQSAAARDEKKDAEQAAAEARQAFDAVAARRGGAVVELHGRRIPDPYQWLEDDTPETQAFAGAQNARSRKAFDALPERAEFARRIGSLLSHARTGVPVRAGERWIFTGNSGSQERDVIYKAATLSGPREVILDPATLSEDGTASVEQKSFSPDGAYMAYSVSYSGSDVQEWRIRSVETGLDLPDEGFSGRAPPAWWAGQNGYFYTNGHVKFHRIGSPSSEDKPAYTGHRYSEPSVTADGRFLIVSQPVSGGSYSNHRVLISDLSSPEPRLQVLYGNGDAYNKVVGSDGDRLFLLTGKGASRRRLVAVDVRRLEPEHWTELIPEGPGRDVLENVIPTDDGFIATWIRDAYHVASAHGPVGERLREIRLPGMGTVTSMSAVPGKGALLGYMSFNQPPTTLYASPKLGRTRAVMPDKSEFDPSRYAVKQVFYRSKDGVKIPMFITHKKGLVLDGKNPTYLYGYGGFGISMTPEFRAGRAAWLEKGGIIAVANIRGGGEYGPEWHDAARLDKKQTSYDDFIAAAKYLIARKYTSARKLGINGRSNGGLLVGAVMTQRSRLFRAAVPEVGVLDLQNYERLGGRWHGDYGSVEDEEGFKNIRRISPVQKIRKGRVYPATLVITGDHDDRVAPAHSHKFTAALQHARGAAAPVFELVQKDAGHSIANAPLSVQNAQAADIWGFLAHYLGLR